MVWDQRGVSSLPTNAAAYADGLVRAWGIGDRGAASNYATAAVVQSLFSFADPGGPHWKRLRREGAAGTIYVTYTNTANGATELSTPL